MSSLVVTYADVDIEKAKALLPRIDSLAEKLNTPLHYTFSYRAKGDFYNQTGNYDQAIDHYKNAISMLKNDSSQIKKYVAPVYNNLGSAYEKKGDYEKALSYYFKALNYWEIHSNKKGISRAYLNIGLIHFRNNNYSKAESFYNKSLELRKEIGDREGEALVYNNLGIVYFYQNKYDQVRRNFEKAYEIYKEEGNLRQQAMSLSNLGQVYYQIGKSEKALEAFKKCIQVEKELKDLSGVTGSYSMIADIHGDRNQYKKAIEYLDKAIAIAKDIKAKKEIKDIYQKYYSIYKTQNNFKQALEWHEKYYAMNDSIYNENKTKQIEELQTQYETEKKEQKIELLNKEKKLQELQIKKQRYFTIFMSLIAFIILVFAIIVLLQKRRLTRAHERLAKQQKQITDSLEYASRIQNAILPSQEQISQVFSFEYFVLFRPKEIVSGDFYFIDQKSDKKIIASVDCTGHGVPGAFMSMLGYSFLSEIVHNQKDLKANEILNRLRDNIIQALNQKNEIGVSKDGMDMSLCIIDEENQKIQFAGAYQYMLFIRNGEVTRYKGDKMPIGIHYKKSSSFQVQEISYLQGDSIYLFSDGFPDQFGGEHNKKFRLKQFQELLVSVSDHPMIEQKDTLNRRFDEWKRNQDQIDDILVMGIRL